MGYPPCRFSSIREGVTLLGSTTVYFVISILTKAKEAPELALVARTPRWTCQEMITCAGVTPSSLEISCTVGFLSDSPTCTKLFNKAWETGSELNTYLVVRSQRGIRFKQHIIFFWPFDKSRLGVKIIELDLVDSGFDANVRSVCKVGETPDIEASAIA